MHRLGAVVVTALVVGAAAFAAATYAGRGDGSFGRSHITMRDDCDSTDPAWAPTGGCALAHGEVSFAEFFAEADSPLAAAVIGHQAWRNDPTYLSVTEGTPVSVTNAGGRAHTFTKVANFGGGVVPPLNEGLTPVPECPGAVVLPGDTTTVSGLAVGNNRFMCCFHPWMRTLVKVREFDLFEP